MSIWDELARRHHSIARGAARDAVPHTQRYKVTGVNPLRVEAMHSDLALSENDEDVDVEQWVHFYHSHVGIRVGDVALARFDGDDYTITGIIGDGVSAGSGFGAGTLADRPDAADVPDGSRYFATDA